MKQFLLCTLMATFLCSCTTAAKRSEPESEYEPQASVPSKKRISKGSTPELAPEATPEPEEVIDLRALQASLHFDPPIDKLGYREKKFNTCKAGAGYSSSRNCRSLNLVVIHFQLMCRDSEGTVSEVVTAANLQPVVNQKIKWTINKASDEIFTDSNGYSQIVMVAPQSQRTQRLRITSDNDFLVIRAGEARSLITPQNWCH